MRNTVIIFLSFIILTVSQISFAADLGFNQGKVTNMAGLPTKQMQQGSICTMEPINRDIVNMRANWEKSDIPLFEIVTGK